MRYYSHRSIPLVPQPWQAIRRPTISSVFCTRRSTLSLRHAWVSQARIIALENKSGWIVCFWTVSFWRSAFLRLWESGLMYSVHRFLEFIRRRQMLSSADWRCSPLRRFRIFSVALWIFSQVRCGEWDIPGCRWFYRLSELSEQELYGFICFFRTIDPFTFYLSPTRCHGFWPSWCRESAFTLYGNIVRWNCIWNIRENDYKKNRTMEKRKKNGEVATDSPVFSVRLAAHVSNGWKSCVLQAVISLPVKVWSR